MDQITIILLFLNDLSSIIESIGNTTCIIGGDWNVPLSYEIDTINYLNKNNINANEAVKNMMSNLDLVDVWRENNINNRKYTWFGPNR